MSVKVLFHGRLGNNLFQYAFGRSVAEQTGSSLRCESPALSAWHSDKSPSLSGPATLDALQSHFPNAPLSLDGREDTEPVQFIDIYGPDGWDGHSLARHALVSDPARLLVLRGYFQRYEYYAKISADILKWFDRPLAAHHPRRDILLTVRRGRDYRSLGWILPTHYYTTLLDTLPNRGDIYVCGVNVDDPLREHLTPYHPVFCAGTPLEQFDLIRSFRRIILANSTFAWWAAYLSEAHEIYGPSASSGYAFTGFGPVDLHMRQARYHEAPVPRFAQCVAIVRSRMIGASITSSNDTVSVDNGATVATLPSHPGGPARFVHTLVRLPIMILSLQPGDVALDALATLERSGLIEAEYHDE